ncbi:high-affinity branched-chain amino acid transport system permease protein LivH [bacterium BMS3Bbin06]|nr:high-affinity branched-chain amino acid transport system permease protein LivH [bacterium BMS3Bbin06]
MLAQLIMSGIATGSLYALTSVAIVLIFRNTRTINLAQGDFSMIGAFMGLVFLKTLHLPFIIAFVATIFAVVLLAVLVERLVMRKIRDADWLTLFTATLGVFYILHGMAGWIWGRDTKAFPNPFSVQPISIGGALISKASLFNILIVAGIGLSLFLFFRYTKAGIAMRAITDDPETARLMGIPVQFIVMLTWAVGGLLAAVAGILLAPIIYVSPQMMDTVLIKGYVGAIFGGLYSIPGAILGSLMIGVIENIAGGYLGAQYKVTIAFVMIVLILAFRPRGLMGGQARREV